jgi:hypothetical protein
MRRNSTDLIGRGSIIFASALAAALLCAGCGKSPAPANNTAKTAAKKTSTTPAAQTPAKLSAAPANAFLSVFSTDYPRDPFHPQIKPKAATPTALTGPPGDAEAPQISAAIQAGFQGIFGAGAEREVMVHDVLLAENREKTMTVFVNRQPRKLKVKAVKIYRTAAELQVEGLSQLVTVPKAQ